MAFPWDIAVSSALPLIGSLLGPGLIGDTQEPGSEYETGLTALKNLNVPGVAEQTVNWQDLARADNLLSGDDLATITADDSSLRDFEGISDIKLGSEGGEDVFGSFMDASKLGLEELREIAESGFSAQDRANMEEIRRRVASEEKGNRDAILQNAMQRGVGGSGLEMMSSLMNQQSSADRRALENIMTEARGEQRRMDASGRGAQLGSALRGQEFGEERTMDEAERMIDQFNKTIAMQKAQGDAGRDERAKFKNYEEAQRIADTNKQMRYEADLRNKGLIQQKYQNELAKAEGMIGGAGRKSDTQSGALDRKYRLYGGGIGGSGKILGDYYAGQKKQKSVDDYMNDFKNMKKKYPTTKR